MPDSQWQYTETSCTAFQVVSMLQSGFGMERWGEAVEEMSHQEESALGAEPVRLEEKTRVCALSQFVVQMCEW